MTSQSDAVRAMQGLMKQKQEILESWPAYTGNEDGTVQGSKPNFIYVRYPTSDSPAVEVYNGTSGVGWIAGLVPIPAIGVVSFGGLLGLSLAPRFHRLTGLAALAAAVSALVLCQSATGSPGDIDTSFGVGGRADLGNLVRESWALEVLADQSAVLAGGSDNCDYYGNYTCEFAGLAGRVSEAGVRDDSFAAAFLEHTRVHDLAVQSDQKIVGVGMRLNATTNGSDLFVFRMLATVHIAAVHHMAHCSFEMEQELSQQRLQPGQQRFHIGLYRLLCRCIAGDHWHTRSHCFDERYAEAWNKDERKRGWQPSG